MRKMRLVDDARTAWRWFSMWAMGVPAAVAAAWLVIPDRLQAVILEQIPPKQMAWALMIVLALGIVGRLVKQGEQ